ncbi:male sterility protein [Tamilnaduibacter salinus]|uniref:Male sterility protein n=1 Tax=Tamilnaduibacter salinus TaxID=1484056 RepID=A0A2U1CUB7_9GAMM|nr:SDR family oxidoreductase [Tamilnaduibacter salinus]PVY70658.1 male sterility protein [Tamilnaduibacter salinus]
MTHHVLATGGTGFIGQHTLASLTGQGHQVHALMRRPDRLPVLRETVRRLGGDHERLHGIKGDLARAGFGWDSPIPSALGTVDQVLHLGALFDWRLRKDQARAVNTEGTRRIVQWCGQQGADLTMVSGFMTHNRSHLVHLGINPESGFADWDRVYRRAGAYEASKLESHFLVKRLAAKNNVPLTVVNPGTLAGHSQTGELAPGQPLAMLIDNLKAGRMAIAPGSSAHWLPLIAVDTLADMLTRCIEDSTTRGRSMLALDPTTPDWPTTLSHFADALGVTPPRLYLPKGLVKATLSLPGMERFMGTPREALDFIQTARFDVSDMNAFVAQHGLRWPSVDHVMHASARHRSSQ